MGMRWTEEQLSAYLDQQLPPLEQRVLEADLVGDAELRRRVTLLRQTLALVQAVPLREPPRNYLLTPAMVATAAPTAPSRVRRGLLPLWLMRMATVVSAAVFAIAVGLNVNPALWSVTQHDSAVMLEQEPELMQVLEAPLAEANVTPAEAEAALKNAPLPAPEVAPGADEPVVALGGFEEGYTGDLPPEGGIGGGAPDSERAFAPVAPEVSATLEICGPDSSEDCVDGTVPMTMTMKAIEALSLTAPVSETAMEMVAGQSDTVEEFERESDMPTAVSPSEPTSPIPLWATGLLALSTAVLGFFTWRLSRRH